MHEGGGATLAPVCTNDSMEGIFVGRPNDEITEAELSVMEVLWRNNGGATVREIVLAMYGRHEHSLHGGVKSFLDRLMEKKYARVDKTQFAHRFSATVSRQEFVGRQLKRIAESHFGGALAPMLLSLVNQAKLSRKDRAAIETIIENIQE
jgi:BlaI family transcriptional regulator, penicillinase repressor